MDFVWLRLEGQNFGDSILDTQDLSTIRGGSLLLRDLVGRVDDWLGRNAPGEVLLATRGGSIGIWRLTIPQAQVGGLLAKLRAHLEHGAFAHLRFGLAAVVDDGGGYRRQRNRLGAAIQRQRLAEERLAWPGAGSGSVCQFDFVRPAVASVKVGLTYWASQSVLDRREYGMNKKQNLIAQETGPSLSAEARAWLARKDGPTRRFAMQINSISEGENRSGLRANLRDKICVITLDGNGFGAIQEKVLEGDDTPEAQKRFDDALGALRETIISAAFSSLVAGDGVGRPSEAENDVRVKLRDPATEVARFELLLWGGDEIMFILPARLGWQVIEDIAKTVGSASLMGSKAHFSIGAVFCHHDAPIARIKKLADDLSSHIKTLKPKDGKGIDGKEATLALIEVLESFDHVGLNLEKHLDRAVPEPNRAAMTEGERKAFKVLDLAGMEKLRLAAEALAAGKGGAVSRGRLRAVALALHKGRAQGASYRTDWRKFVKDAAKLLEGDAAAARDHFGADRFFALLEPYWDYLVPIRADAPTEAGQAKAEAAS